MTRLTHIILLLLSLVVIVSIGLSGPGSFGEGVGDAGLEKSPVELPKAMNFNPEPPSPLPDLNEGYVFIEDRVLLESDFETFQKGGKKDTKIAVSTVDLEDVLYSGSVIIGDLRKALVTYPFVERKERKGAKKGRTRGRAVMKHEHLDQGGEFMGFLVASVEEDRIVFERDGERVEKFLHDQSKDRIIVKSKARNPVRKTPEKKAPGATPKNPALSRQPAVKPAAPRKLQPPEDLPQRRSQRLLRRDPSLLMPSSMRRPPVGTSGSE